MLVAQGGNQMDEQLGLTAPRASHEIDETGILLEKPISQGLGMGLVVRQHILLDANGLGGVIMAVTMPVVVGRPFGVLLAAAVLTHLAPPPPLSR
jgi:hypothetical protein